MQKRERVFRCLVKRDGDLWVALCVDLSLAAQADSLDEAKGKLEAQIADYIREAFAEPEYAEQLLNRKAPLSQRVDFRIAQFKLWLIALLHRQETQSNFLNWSISERTLRPA
jgi:hypothetical protein